MVPDTCGHSLEGSHRPVQSVCVQPPGTGPDWTGVLQVVLSEGARVAGASRGPELLCANLKGWGLPAPQAGPEEECTRPPAAALEGGSSRERWER